MAWMYRMNGMGIPYGGMIDKWAVVLYIGHKLLTGLFSA